MDAEDIRLMMRMRSTDQHPHNTVIAGELVGGIGPYALHNGLYEILARRDELSEEEIIEIVKEWEQSHPEEMADCALWAGKPRDPRLGPLQRPVRRKAKHED